MSPIACRPARTRRRRSDSGSSTSRRVEHAIVLGVPSLDEQGAPRLAAGLGRPLILTTLQTDEAMRILPQTMRAGRSSPPSRSPSG